MDFFFLSGPSLESKQQYIFRNSFCPKIARLQMALAFICFQF